MKKIYTLSLLLIATSFYACTEQYADPTYNKGINIVPKPLIITQGDGRFEINDETQFDVSGDESIASIVNLFQEKIKNSTGIELATGSNIATNYIKVSLDNALIKNEEGYQLSTSKNGVEITAIDYRGVFYGLTTLMQLLPAEINSSSLVENIKWDVPFVSIVDEPRFQWRGFHLDVGRHFISVEEIKKNIDVLASLKLNKFHWHLTEDQGWRIEIKKYPKLTTIGATRTEADGSTHQGYYTQAQIKEVVKYAADRYIDVIPEIEMPGHALAALSAYPELSCKGGPFTPRIIWGVETDIFCAGNDATFDFLQDVIEEILPLFPYEYYHMGGDESPKTRWKTCPKCQKRIADNGLKNEHELQSYFMNRMEQFLISKDKKMIGWDEILEGGVTKSANIMSWRGEEGGIDAANAGNDVIMTPGKWMYFDKYEGSHKIDPVSIGGLLPLETVYNYEPIPLGIAPEKANHVLGAQSTMWSEYIYDEKQIEYRMYPRILALAELTWTPKDQKDYKDFEKRLNNQLVRLDGQDINYYIPLPEGPSNNIAFLDSILLTFETPRPVDKIVYTTGDQELSTGFKVYTEPLIFRENTTLKIASVLPQGKMSTVRTIHIFKQKLSPAVDKPDLKNGLSTRTSYGNFIKIADLEHAKIWEDGQIDSLSQCNTTFNWGHEIKPENLRAVEINGYINVADDDVYYFSSNQDQVWIDDQLVINNDGFVKRFSQNDGSIALAAGKHKLRIIYLNNVYKGWASDWNTVELKYRNSNQNEMNMVPANMLYYE